MSTTIDSLVDRLDGDPAYIRFLLAERAAILSPLYGQGQAYDPEAATLRYSSIIGSSIHCDIIELNVWLDSLNEVHRSKVLNWAARTEIRPVFGKAELRLFRSLLNAKAQSNVAPA